MQYVYFTLVAVVLYLLSSWIVDRIEMAAGKRFEQRSVLFFGIFLVLTLIAFGAIQSYTGNP